MDIGTRSPLPLVDIVSGSFGAGHDAAAAAIAEQLDARGVRTRIWDVVDLMPGRFGRVLRTGYLRQVQTLPDTWRWVLDRLDRSDRTAALVTRALATASGALLEIAAHRPDQIVSTHPFASQVLGRLRDEGRLDVPVTTYLTDMSVHRLWVHPGVDHHLAIHDLPALEACALGARDTRTVVPAVAGRFGRHDRSRTARTTSRATFGLPASDPLALVTGGSRGIGDLQRSTRELAATGIVTPVVLCGTNERLRRRIDRTPGTVALGWVGDMPRLLGAVDVVVQNAGGITSLEARATGAPVVTYRCIAGHGETNAAALDTAGLAPWVRRPEDLPAALLHALGTAVSEPPSALDAAGALLGAPALAA